MRSGGGGRLEGGKGGYIGIQGPRPRYGGFTRMVTQTALDPLAPHTGFASGIQSNYS